MSNEDEKVLKALVSDTRRDIVKKLSDGDRTPSDLSKMLDKSKSTIVEHLEKLVKAGLVEKNEKDGRKWVFYSLTRKGESYVSQKSKKLIIILSTVFISLLGGVFSLIKHLSKEPMANIEPKLFRVTEGATADAMTSTTPWFLYLSIGLFTLALVGIFVIILMKRKRLVDV
jgi:DNA-binding transcriptional ArsR family regulator